MTIPKILIIYQIESSYYKLKIELDNISDVQSKDKAVEGHNKNNMISICDLVAYLIGWGELVLKWNTIKSYGKEPDFPETGYKWNELGLLAKKFYSDYKNDDYETLLNKLDMVVQNILTLILQHDNKILYESPWYRKYTMGRMIQLNTLSPYKKCL